MTEPVAVAERLPLIVQTASPSVVMLTPADPLIATAPVAEMVASAPAVIVADPVAFATRLPPQLTVTSLDASIVTVVALMMFTGWPLALTSVWSAFK